MLPALLLSSVLFSFSCPHFNLSLTTDHVKLIALRAAKTFPRSGRMLHSRRRRWVRHEVPPQTRCKLVNIHYNIRKRKGCYPIRHAFCTIIKGLDTTSEVIASASSRRRAREGGSADADGAAKCRTLRELQRGKWGNQNLRVKQRPDISKRDAAIRWSIS